MAETISSDSCGDRAAMLGHLPEHQRHRILSGMRWTVWLSAIAVPFSIAVNLLLARVGPVTLGVYGLLSVYISLTSALLYFGGDTVVMRFIPECSPEDRASFLISYLSVILAVMSGWLVFAWFCPAAMRLAFGETHGGSFNFLLLCLSIVPISFAMVVASLKGMLEIQTSQLLAKTLTIGSLAIYAAIFVFNRSLLSVHPMGIIWSVYLGLSAMLAILGAIKLIRLCRAARLRWFLPTDFWRYSFSTQQVSITSFFAQKLDYVLIVNLGGLKLLGEYVAVVTVAGIVPMVSGFFMDTLLPSLTNTVVARNYAGAAQVFTMHMRILFLVITAMSCAVMALAVPATAVMGAKYASLGALIIFMAASYGIAIPGTLGGTVLASIGRQQLAVWTRLLNLGLFIGLFFPLWRRWNLAGAVVAFGLALMISNALLMTIALKTAGFFPSISGLWLKSAAVQATVAVIALWWMPLGFASAVVVWLGAMVLFLWLSGYGLAECQGLLQTFLPGHFGRFTANSDAPATTPAEPQVISR
ncbi:MAG: lipopolysaccharide biosynthesis protein [Candidatus Binataceae bacterium]